MADVSHQVWNGHYRDSSAAVNIPAQKNDVLSVCRGQSIERAMP